ncbi:MAG: NADH-quinone oxidoreductase subunit NuoN [Betaproteobacteria bacterium AqS2]|uniref:NADH-quinone oxidoreductase subunit N n=1 Tax=Candidatus Amphirhobacter heronislandensis TaxID=1732024 RepID=A0A930UHN8_9GAMM|nr:NADH-quinone oxidoreductase subunit NuoN [Betaproteobacteria bacterium AqS2]
MAELNLGAAAPELFLFLGGCALLLLATTRLSGRLLLHGANLILAGAALLLWLAWPAEIGAAFSGLYEVSALTAMLQMGILLATIGALSYSGDYLAQRGMLTGEYLALGLFAATGMLLLAAARHLLALYLGLELMSLSLYAMIALRRDDVRAIEAALKYFVLGAIASGLLLYGISLVYAATLQLELPAVAAAAADAEARGVLLAGLAFIVAGAAFKLGAAPFHMWLPDVYDGAPTAATMFIGGAPKIAAYALAIRLLAGGLEPLVEEWSGLLASLAVASLGVGNVIAIAQTSVKRMLAYSAISHMGFLLTGIVAGSEEGYAAAMFYAFVYALMSIGGFGMLALLSRADAEFEMLADVKGLAKRNPAAAALTLILMLSMAGIPPLAGFYAKLAVWSAAVGAGWTWLAVVAGLFSVVGAFYYLRVVKLMYFDAPDGDAPAVALRGPYLLLAAANGLLIILLGLFPGGLLRACQLAFG